MPESRSTWAAGMGQPLRIRSARDARDFSVRSSPEMIRRIISAEERRFGPISSMVYPPLADQPNYRIELGGNEYCIGRIFIIPSSK
jgi:hypothetical protein